MESVSIMDIGCPLWTTAASIKEANLLKGLLLNLAVGLNQSPVNK